MEMQLVLDSAAHTSSLNDISYPGESTLFGSMSIYVLRFIADINFHKKHMLTDITLAQISGLDLS